MRFTTWIKIFFFLFVVGFLTIFYLQNTHHVGIQFPFGRPYQFRLIFMLLISFFSGVITTILGTAWIRIKWGKMHKEEESEELVEDEE